MSWKYKISLVVSIAIMAIFFATQSLLVFKFMKYADEIGYFGYSCFLAFIPFFFVVISEYIKKNNINRKYSKDFLICHNRGRNYNNRGLYGCSFFWKRY
jgi:hypothetical protein